MAQHAEREDVVGTHRLVLGHRRLHTLVAHARRRAEQWAEFLWRREAAAAKAEGVDGEGQARRGRGEIERRAQRRATQPRRQPEVGQLGGTCERAHGV